MASTTPSRRSRAQGAIVGVCVCDALGGPVQFQTRGSFRRVDGYRYISHFDQPPGAWSDDGSLTLCLALSLIENGFEYSAEDFVRKLCAWHDHGFLSSSDAAWDEGLATSQACRAWAAELAAAARDRRPVDVPAAQALVDRLLDREPCSGNGSLMRVAPLGVALHRVPHRAVAAARRQSDTTHPYAACGDACALYTALVCRCMTGASKQDLATLVAHADISNRVLRERLLPYTGLSSWEQADGDAIRSTGWVVDTIEAALWAFFSTASFEEGALKAVNLGDDADTVGAVYGGLAGAFYGLEGIPRQWTDGLVKSELVLDIASRLSEGAD